MILLTRSATKKDRNGVKSSAVNSAMVSLNSPLAISILFVRSSTDMTKVEKQESELTGALAVKADSLVWTAIRVKHIHGHRTHFH